MTIRRDIEDLEKRGLVKRVHGGAISSTALLAEPLFSVKSQLDVGSKDMIARAALEYVSPGDVIAISGGSTMYIFAQRLMESPRSEGITILTNSVPVAELVQSKGAKDVQMIVTGGIVSRSNSLVGPIADKTILALRVSCAFLGAHSISLSRGFLTPNPLEASTNAAFMSIADHSIILADHTKWDNTSLSVFASFSSVSKLVTDSQLPLDVQKQMRTKLPLVVAPAAQDEGLK